MDISKCHIYYDADGKPAGVEGNIRDITKIKKPLMLFVNVKSSTGFG